MAERSSAGGLTKMRSEKSFANLFLGLYLAAGTAAVAYTFFISEAEPQALLKYQLALLVLLVLGAASVRLPLRVRSGLSLSFLTLLAGLLTVDWLLGYQSYRLPNMKDRMAIQEGRTPDPRSGAEVIADLRTGGEMAYPISPPQVFAPTDGLQQPEGGRIYPLGGISDARTVFCNEQGVWLEYRSDRYGFNNPDFVHESSGIDIVLIGDSYTHGICMPENQDIAGLLRAAGYATLNFGYAGNGLLTELGTLEEYASLYRPSIVLWVYYEGNDLFSHLEEGRSAQLMRYLDPVHAQGLAGKQAQIDALLKRYWDQRLSQQSEGFDPASQLACRISLCSLRALLGEYDRPPPPPIFESILRSADERVAAWGGRLYFVYLPAWRRYQAPFQPDAMFSRAEVLRTVADLGIPIIDFSERLSVQADPLDFYPFRLPLHFNERGYQLLATQILENLP